MSDVKPYPVVASEDLFLNRFVSHGNSTILKEVAFERIRYSNVYNLALGDIDPITQEPNYTVKSKNNDLENVFATVAWIITKFTEKYPHCLVHIRGDKDYKSRAYRYALNKFLTKLANEYEIWGVIGDITDTDSKLEEYEPTKKYDAFLVKGHMTELDPTTKK